MFFSGPKGGGRALHLGAPLGGAAPIQPMYRPVVGRLLETAWLVALRHQRAWLTGSEACLNAGSLGERLVVNL